MEVCGERPGRGSGAVSQRISSSGTACSSGRSEVVTSSCQGFGVQTRTQKRKAEAAGFDQPPGRQAGSSVGHLNSKLGKSVKIKLTGSSFSIEHNQSSAPYLPSPACSEPESSVLTLSSSRQCSATLSRPSARPGKLLIPLTPVADDSDALGSTVASCITSCAGVSSVSRPQLGHQAARNDQAEQELSLLADEGDIEDSPRPRSKLGAGLSRGALAQQEDLGDVVTDIDGQQPSCNIQMCGDYEREIFENLRERESSLPALEDFLVSRQRDLTAHHRSIMVNWLVEFVNEFNLQSESLYRAVAVMDRCLHDGPSIRKQSLQLLGMACLLIAAKLEETQPPSMIPEFCEVADYSFSAQQIISMEGAVLKTLAFRCSFPTTYDFLWRYLKAANANKETERMAEFLASLSLMDYGMLGFQPSMVAASCVFLANHTCNWEPWTATLEHYSGYRAFDLKNCVERLHSQHKDQDGLFVELSAVKDKYWLPEEGAVAGIVPKPCLPDCLYQGIGVC